MNLHVRALFAHDTESRLTTVNEPDGPSVPAPRLFLGRTRAGCVWRIRADLPQDLFEDLNSVCGNEPSIGSEFNTQPLHVDRYIRLLETHAPIERVSTGPAYYFPEDIAPSRLAIAMTENDAAKLKGGFEELVAELPGWQPFVALIEGERAVSVCRSVRITSDAHEAGVETLPAFRGRGYAKDVSAEWAKRVRAAGAIPLYSTSWENRASQAVARQLHLECYGSDFQII